MLIDTHAHLDDARYDSDREATIERARQAGVRAFVTIGCDLTTSRSAVTLADRGFPIGVVASVVQMGVGIDQHADRKAGLR